MRSIHKKRLLQLAEHLETGQLGHKDFTMRDWNNGPYDEKGCGTAGCAIGECPIVFPKEWEFASQYGGYFPLLRGQPSGSLVMESVVKFFGNTTGVSSLFAPTSNYTVAQQAKRIRRFVAKMGRNNEKKTK
jgi:hypothetical protein